MEKNKTLVVNLLGGPGCGKSSLAYGLTSKLKWKGIDCELASEFAKDLVWEKRNKTFENQIYIFGKQHHRIFRLLGQVQVVITDSPLFLTPIYDPEKRESLKSLVINEINKCNNLNIVVDRVKQYNPNGRKHNLKEAEKIDELVIDFLVENKFYFYLTEGSEKGLDNLVNLVLREL